MYGTCSKIYMLNCLNCLHTFKVQFEDVLGEPDGARSIGCIWKLSYTCFECGKGLCYKLLTTLCGICIALSWGCDFAIIAFTHIWIYTPAMRDFTICLGCCQKIFATIVDCCCAPVCSACGSCLSRIKITKG